MTTTDDIPDVLSEMDRFVRLMAMASGADGVIQAVRAYLASWTRERVIRLQSTDAGWAPFDEYQRPFPVLRAGDIRQLGGSVRIRCRELEASDRRIAPELRELDLFFFFADESLAVHEPVRPRRAARAVPGQSSGFRRSGNGHNEQRI